MHATHNTVTDLVTPARTLRDAARYLLCHGWHQGDLFANLDLVESGDLLTPAACTLGAIHMQVRGTPVIGEWSATEVQRYDQAVGALVDHLVLDQGVTDPHTSEVFHAGVRELLVGDWNDDPARIAAHVVAALYGAADEWDRLHPTSPCLTPSGVA